MIFLPFRSRLARHMESDEMVLPLGERGRALLTGLLQTEGESIYLTVRDDRHEEEIEAGILCGQLVVLARGVGGTVPRKFPAGAEVVFRVTVSVVEKLICQTDCCPESPCECRPAAFAGTFLPDGAVGQEWRGVVLFSGDPPLSMGWKLPDWMAASRDERVLTLTGTPTAAGEATVTVAASNCGGSQIATESFQFTVS
jgi:hypothetical protein